jgi:hypothetical protein
MNLQDRDVELNWREVTCKRSVDGDSFARGIQDFDFSVSGKNAFIPSLSYFLIDVELRMFPTKFPRMQDNLPSSKLRIIDDVRLARTADQLLRRPVVSDGIALADHFGSTLYNNAFFRAGNSDVSLITQYIPQAGVLKSRLDKSNAWSRNIGRIVFQDDADFERRRQYISFDGTFHDDGLKPLQYTDITEAGIVKLDKNGKAGNTLPAITFAVGAAVDIPPANVPIFNQNNGQAANVSIVGAGAFATQNVSAGAFGATRTLGLLTVQGQQTDGTLNFNVSAIPNGTVLVVGAVAGDARRFIKILYPISNRAGNDVDLVYAAEILGAADGAVNGNILFMYVPHDPACGSHITQVMFQPPIGIFSEANAISGGDFKISLNPSPSYATNGIQSIVPMTAGSLSSQAPFDYELLIKNVKFYVATIKSDVSPTGVIPLTLIEMAVLNKTLNPSGGLQNLDFTVPPSTLAITVFVQGGDAGTQTVIPATKFYLQGDGADGGKSTDVNPVTGIPVGLYNNIANNVQNVQVTYGSVTKTQTLYSSAYDSDIGINSNVQRFLQSIQYSGKITSEGGSESHPQYLERGNYWHFDFSKDKNDTSSYVNVQIGFKDISIGTSQNLFIVAHYSRQCEISYENGFITQVVSVNR